MRLGPAAIPWIVSATTDTDPRVRILACSILRRIAPVDQALETLASALKDSDPSVRKAAVERLAWEAESLATRAGDGSRHRIIEALRSVLADGDNQVRVASAQALGRLGPEASPAVADLGRALAAPDPAFRLAAAQALLRVDPAGSLSRVISVARSMLADPTVKRQRYELVQLLKAETGEDGTAEALIALLDHAELWIRHDAISSLIAQCPGASATRPALVRALDDGDGGLRCEAALYFLKQDPELASRSLEVLIGQLLDPLEGSYLPWDIIRKLRV